MLNEFKYISVNNIFNNTIESCKKVIEVYLYRLWSLDRNIDIKFNKPLGEFDSNHFIKLCLLKIKNIIRLKDEFNKLINNAQKQIISLNNR